MLLQSLNINFPINTKFNIFLHYNPHFHILINFQRSCNNTFSIQLFTDYPCTHSIPIKPNCQIKQSCPVPNFYIFISVNRAKYFFRKIKRIVIPLLKRQIWIFLQIFKTNAFFFCQRMIITNKNMWLCSK